MNQWLQNFAYRVDMGWYVFLLSGIIAFAIVLSAVCFQAVKAAKANPIDSLNYE